MWDFLIFYQINCDFLKDFSPQMNEDFLSQSFDQLKVKLPKIV